MTRDQGVLLAAVGGLALLCLWLLVVVQRLRASGTRSHEDVVSLRERLERLEDAAVSGEASVDAGRDAARVAGPAARSPATPAPVEFVITELGSRVEPAAEPVHLDGATFADILLKETVVRAASLAHGLRRGLAPEARNRIRFEMRREVRRARKQRRADLKAAQRDLQARQRAALLVETEEAS